MQFLSDVFIRCPDCLGRRYRDHILEVRLESQPGARPKQAGGAGARSPREPGARPRIVPLVRSPDQRPLRSWSIADLLEATVDDAVDFLEGFGAQPAGRRAVDRLKLLQDVGLGYLRLGQPINTLSGGESQRLKLITHLADAGITSAPDAADACPAAPLRLAQGRPGLARASRGSLPRASRGAILFLFDEPTTGLHFEDVRILLEVFQRLVEAGHSLVVIEHNLDVIKCADWVIDLGPEAGERGGQLVAQGAPEAIAACAASHTGRFLRDVLRPSGREQLLPFHSLATPTT